MFGTKCDYCERLHGVRYWKIPEVPYLQFNSKKCMKAYIREHNQRIITKKTSMALNTQEIKTNKVNRAVDMLSNSTIVKAKQISRYAQEYCSSKCHGRYCKPKDILPYLVDKGVFNQVDNRHGRELRKVLRNIDAAGILKELIPQVAVERKTKNRYWYFKAI